MGTWGSVLVALVVPLAWGLLSAWLFEWWQARRNAGREKDQSEEAGR